MFRTSRFLTVSAIGIATARADLPSKPAAEFIDSIGVCTHWGYGDTPYGFAAEKVKQQLVASGIRNIRDGNSPRVIELGKLGIRTTFVVDDQKPAAESLEIIKKANAAGALINAVEGPNEPDNFWIRFKKSYNGHGYEQGLPGIVEGVIAFQKDLYTAIKSDPATKNIIVIGPSSGKTYDPKNPNPFGEASMADAVDWGNFHPYPGGNPFTNPFPYAGVERYLWHGGQPTTVMDESPYAFKMFGTPFSPKPMAATETGYSTYSDGPSETSQAKYLPRLFCEFFRLGVQRTFSYELIDEWNKPDDREANFGLLRFDQSPKPAFTALQRLIKLVDEPGAKNFETKPLPGTLETTAVRQFTRTQYVHHLALQKSDGTFVLLIWHDIALDDTDKKPWHRVPLAPPMPTKLTLTQAAKHVKIYIPNDGEETVRSLENTSEIQLDVPDRVMVVKLAF